MFPAESSRLGVGSTRRGLRAVTLGSLGGVASSLSMVAAGSASVLWTWRDNAVLTTGCTAKFMSPRMWSLRGSRTNWIPFDSRSHSALGRTVFSGVKSIPCKCNLKTLGISSIWPQNMSKQFPFLVLPSVREMRKFTSIHGFNFLAHSFVSLISINVSGWSP